MEGNRTDDYKIVPEVSGNRYRFYCMLSGALTCITEPIRAKTPEVSRLRPKARV